MNYDLRAWFDNRLEVYQEDPDTDYLTAKEIDEIEAFIKGGSVPNNEGFIDWLSDLEELEGLKGGLGKEIKEAWVALGRAIPFDRPAYDRGDMVMLGGGGAKAWIWFRLNKIDYMGSF